MLFSAYGIDWIDSIFRGEDSFGGFESHDFTLTFGRLQLTDFRFRKKNHKMFDFSIISLHDMIPKLPPASNDVIILT